MKKTFEFFVLNMSLSTAQEYDLEIMVLLLEHKVEPLCIEFIKICLQNLFTVPVKSRFSSWGFCKPIFIQPTIHVWGFILKMLYQRQIRGGGESSNYDEDYIKTVFSIDIIDQISLLDNHEYHLLLMDLKIFSNHRFIWFNKYSKVYGKYFTNIIANTFSFNDKDVLNAITNVSYLRTEHNVLPYAITFAKKIRFDSTHTQWECLFKLFQISGDKYWDTVIFNDEITVAQENLCDVCSTVFDLIITNGNKPFLNDVITKSSFILSTIYRNKK